MPLVAVIREEYRQCPPPDPRRGLIEVIERRCRFVERIGPAESATM
jgi:hypothetical protein